MFVTFASKKKPFSHLENEVKSCGLQICDAPGGCGYWYAEIQRDFLFPLLTNCTERTEL